MSELASCAFAVNARRITKSTQLIRIQVTSRNQKVKMCFGELGFLECDNRRRCLGRNEIDKGRNVASCGKNEGRSPELNGPIGRRCCIDDAGKAPCDSEPCAMVMFVSGIAVTILSVDWSTVLLAYGVMCEDFFDVRCSGDRAVESDQGDHPQALPCAEQHVQTITCGSTLGKSLV